MNKAKYIFASLIHPHNERSRPSISPLRFFLLQTRVFAVMSLIMQLRYSRRVKRIQHSVPQDTYFAEVHRYTSETISNTPVEYTRRMDIFYQVLSLPPRDLSKEKLLIIGPKNVRELLIAWLYGYKWDNIQGIDLYSLHPKITTMNMEYMTFPEEYFDAVTMANTFNYSKDPFRCLSEVARVLKTGGRFVFDASYDPEVEKWAVSRIPGNQLRQMLKELSFNPIFYSPTDKLDKSGRYSTSHLISVQKIDPLKPGFDRINW